MSFETIMRTLPQMNTPAAPTGPTWCPPAERFHAVAEALTTTLLTTPTAMSLNQAKVVLVDLYLAVRAEAGHAHRDKLSPRGHACVYRAFIERLEQLNVLAVTVLPPVLTKSPARRPAAPIVDQRLPAIVLGVHE